MANKEFERFWKRKQDCIVSRIPKHDLERIKYIQNLLNNVADMCNIIRDDDRPDILKENEIFDEVLGCNIIGYYIYDTECGGEDCTPIDLILLCKDKLKVLTMTCRNGGITTKLLKEE